MRIGDQVSHRFTPKKRGVLVQFRGEDCFVLWMGENLPRTHPRDYIVSVEQVGDSIPDATGVSTEDEDDVEPDSGVSELSLTILAADADEPETEVEEQEIEVEVDSDDVIAPEIIERD
jgi:hypothetical protein